MRIQARQATAEDVLYLRTRLRDEARCQIVHDSIHRRDGWTRTYLLEVDGLAAGFGSVAINGPWKEKPTVFEFYILPVFRLRSFDLFEAFLTESGAKFFEVQSNDELLAVMLHTYGREIVTESIVFRDHVTTTLCANGAALKRVTEIPEIRLAIERRQGGGEWELEHEGKSVAKGGILFHYNRPYGDIYMEVVESFRGRGFGSYLVQELKRECYSLGAIPAARCNPGNIASRKTLQKAGFVPYAHILDGVIPAGLPKPATISTASSLPCGSVLMLAVCPGAGMMPAFRVIRIAPSEALRHE